MSTFTERTVLRRAAGTICRICGVFVRRDESHTCSYPPADPLRRLLIAARAGVVEWQGTRYALTWDMGE